MRKPRLFIASSVESIPIAEAVNVNLDHQFEVTIWTGGTFKLSSSTIEDLVEKSSTVDFALFIFAPDDVALIRDEKQYIVRDNVVFELGLFVGAIGKERSFILKPRDVDIHLPTDLLGVTPADYDANRSDGDLVSATNRACSLIKTESASLGILNRSSLSESRAIIANPVDYKLKEQDYKFLASCLQSQVTNPIGLPFYMISDKLNGVDDSVLQLSLVKLERMGLLSKSIEIDHQEGYEFYAYSITELGVDELLENEDYLQPKTFKVSNSFNENIPF